MPEIANRISVDRRPSTYVAEPHLVVLIDGRPLDELIAELARDSTVKGLVSPLDDCLHSIDDRQLVWERILPEPGQSTVAPILVCPDDLDFDCTVVVAEIRASSDAVVWRRIGLDRRGDSPKEPVGSNVQWWERLGPFKFDSDSYTRFLAECRALRSDWWERRTPETP